MKTLPSENLLAIRIFGLLCPSHQLESRRCQGGHKIPPTVHKDQLPQVEVSPSGIVHHVVQESFVIGHQGIVWDLGTCDDKLEQGIVLAFRWPQSNPFHSKVTPPVRPLSPRKS